VFKTFGKARDRAADGERFDTKHPGPVYRFPLLPKMQTLRSPDLPHSAHDWRYRSRSSLPAVIDPVKHPPQRPR